MNSKNKNLAPMLSTGKNDWGTDPKDFNALNDIFGFEVDVCASAENAKCSAYFDERANTLEQDWGKRICWMNPPFGQPENPCKPNCEKKKCTKKQCGKTCEKDCSREECKPRGCIDKYIPGQIDFVRKAYEEVEKGCWVVCIVPSRTDTGGWHKYLLRARSMMFYKGRQTFEGAKDAAPFPCTIFVFTPYETFRTPKVILGLKDLSDEYKELITNWKKKRDFSFL